MGGYLAPYEVGNAKSRVNDIETKGHTVFGNRFNFHDVEI